MKNYNPNYNNERWVNNFVQENHEFYYKPEHAEQGTGVVQQKIQPYPVQNDVSVQSDFFRSNSNKLSNHSNLNSNANSINKPTLITIQSEHKFSQNTKNFRSTPPTTTLNSFEENNKFKNYRQSENTPDDHDTHFISANNFKPSPQNSVNIKFHNDASTHSYSQLVQDVPGQVRNPPNEQAYLQNQSENGPINPYKNINKCQDSINDSNPDYYFPEVEKTKPIYSNSKPGVLSSNDKVHNYHQPQQNSQTRNIQQQDSLANQINPSQAHISQLTSQSQHLYQQNEGNYFSHNYPNAQVGKSPREESSSDKYDDSSVQISGQLNMPNGQKYQPQSQESNSPIFLQNSLVVGEHKEASKNSVPRANNGFTGQTKVFSGILFNEIREETNIMENGFLVRRVIIKYVQAEGFPPSSGQK